MRAEDRKRLADLLQAWGDHWRKMALDEHMTPIGDSRDYAFAYWLIRHSGWTVAPPAAEAVAGERKPTCPICDGDHP